MNALTPGPGPLAIAISRAGVSPDGSRARCTDEYGSQSPGSHGTIGVLMRSLSIAILITGAAVAGACGEDSKLPPDQDSAVQLAEAREMFSVKCARCHGSAGGVNGFSSSILRPRPHNYTDPAWQASVTDDQIKEVILRGGVNLGKSPAMPSYPTLRNRPELLNGLVKLIRGFGKHP